MFGWRNDGINVSKQVDPIILFTPLIMPTRCESMNSATIPVEYEPMANYIKKRKDLPGLSFLTIMAAAYARTLLHYPNMNWFCMGNRIYQHRDATVSMIVLQDTGGREIRESAIKISLDRDDTVMSVTEKANREILKARNDGENNGTAKFASTLLRIPVLPSLVVLLARLMDRIGILPRAIAKLSPFHCSLFITNMMSIGMPSIYHHLYNFGTCSIFLSFGKPERELSLNAGKISRRFKLPMGLVTDERICGGADYAHAVACFMNYLKRPELLELSPEEEAALSEN